MKIAFSTLGCPAWSLEHTTDRANDMGYDGIELRLLDGDIVNPAMRDKHRDRVRAAGQRICLPTLASSVRLAAARPEQTVADLVAMIELAADWGLSRVRVFGGHPLDGETMSHAAHRAAEIVDDALTCTRHLNVGVAIETHDDFAASARVAELIEAVDEARFTAIWDTEHTWRAGESPEQTWRTLGRYITEIQLRDVRLTGDASRQTQLGEGEVPVRECLDVALADEFDGWLSVEWVKHWQPSLDEPEVALPAHRATIADWLAGPRPSADSSGFRGSHLRGR